MTNGCSGQIKNSRLWKVLLGSALLLVCPLLGHMEMPHGNSEEGKQGKG